MKTIYKYSLAIEDVVRISMPKGAKILDVLVQGETPKIWVEVEPGKSHENRTFRVFGTGHWQSRKEDKVYRYISTFIAGPFVWHVYEELENTHPGLVRLRDAALSIKSK